MNIQDAIAEFREQLNDAVGSSKTKEFQITNIQIFQLEDNSDVAGKNYNYRNIDDRSNTIQVESSSPSKLIATGEARSSSFTVAFDFDDIGHNSGFTLISPSSSPRIESIQALFMNHLDGYAKAFNEALIAALSSFGEDDGSDNEKDEK